MPLLRGQRTLRALCRQGWGRVSRQRGRPLASQLLPRQL